MPEKTYLGDAVYVEFDGYCFKLTTENGVRATNTIYLEPGPLKSLQRYVEAVREAARKSAE